MLLNSCPPQFMLPTILWFVHPTWDESVARGLPAETLSSRILSVDQIEWQPTQQIYGTSHKRLTSACCITSAEKKTKKNNQTFTRVYEVGK